MKKSGIILEWAPDESQGEILLHTHIDLQNRDILLHGLSKDLVLKIESI
jgi:hypothetical protein